MILPGFPKMMVVSSGWSVGEYVAAEGGYYIGDLFIPDDGLGGNTYSLFTPIKSVGQADRQWRTTDTGLAGAGSQTNGKANMSAMVAAGVSSFPAANYCQTSLNNVNHGGKNDWYFPAIAELGVLYDARGTIPAPDTIDTDANFYWSSSGYTANPSAGYPWRKRFSDGYQDEGNFGADTVYRVRFIRRILAG